METELKKVEDSDWDTILQLRNDFYENFYIQKKPLTKKEHYKYLKEQKKNPKFHHWMIIVNNNVAGYIRIKNNDIGIIIGKEFQNKGIGSIALKLAEQKARLLGLSKLVALVKIENESSKKIFEKNGYDLKMIWLEKDI